MFTDWNHKEDGRLVLLENSEWPEEVKAHIVAAYAAHGEDIAGRKLIEKSGHRFVDHKTTGKIDWNLAKDYFTWEAASLHDAATSEMLQQESMTKRGFMFNHYQVYDYPDSF